MSDFFEYVVAELKSKRLSRANAVDLVRQFSTRGSNTKISSVLHPLLHRNTSDISEQRYTTTIKGDEVFLADHKLVVTGSEQRRLLPGSAYLEMARAAIEDALPSNTSTPKEIELHNIVWLQPFFVTGSREINIGLWARDAEIDYEIYSVEVDQKIIYCMGSATWSAQQLPPSLDMEELEKQLDGKPLQAERVYERFLRAGMIYGPSFQVITSMRRGDGHVLAYLRLPVRAREDQASYVLHPNLLDGALQTCIGLTDERAEGDEDPRLPYALDSIRIHTPCKSEMIAWSHSVLESHAPEGVVKVDSDLFDMQGKICASVRGFSYRVAKNERSQQRTLQTFVPVWNPFVAEPRHAISTSDKVLLIGPDKAHLHWLQQSHFNTCQAPLPVAQGTEAIATILKEQHFDHLLWIAPEEQTDGPHPIDEQDASVLMVFRVIKALLRMGYGDKKLRWTLILGGTHQFSQCEAMSPAHAAVVGLIGSLAKEYPLWSLSLLDVSSIFSLSASECLSMPHDPRGNVLVRREGEWLCQQFVPPIISPAQQPARYRQDGVYVVIGGAGGLGGAWTRMMIEQYKAHIIWIGRRDLDREIEARVDSLSNFGPRPWYLQADAGNFAELQRAGREILERYPIIHGVVHAAIDLRDQTIARMDERDFLAGLSAKVHTSINLDRVFGELDLDFILFFSSVVSFVKSPAQSNYAAGSSFVDSFAFRLRQRRSYPVKVMNWGYWGSVGAATSQAYKRHMESMGIASIEPVEGMECLQSLLSSDLMQMAAIKMIDGRPIPYVDLLHFPENSKVSAVEDIAFHKVIIDAKERSLEESSTSETGGIPASESTLREKGVAYFQKLIASTLKMQPEQIEAHRALADYGLDSIVAGQLTFRLRKAFTGITALLLFEIKDIHGLTDYFLENNREEFLAALHLKTEISGAVKLEHRDNHAVTPIVGRQITPTVLRERSSVRSSKDAPLQLNTQLPANKGRSVFDVAVIGMSGRYPSAENLEDLWANLAQGVNCITEIPAERWHWQDYFDPQKGKAGKIYTKWGGFLKNIDHFDPLFFKIAPQQAKLMDPQERVFLQSCYHAIEDAGYTPETLGQPDEIGVFVGVMNARYAPQPSHFSIANRVSYLFNYQGPSMAIDTACSSSLTAIHLALESLYCGESTCVIAGGVNLIIDATHYLQLTDLTMLSSGNECRAFGSSADGTVDSEGVGVVILKPLQQAERDGDHIYGVLKGSAVNAGGKTNGYTVPSVQAQSRLISRALDRSNVSAEYLTYIEAHGTGTPLGDPIEIAGLTRAFGSTTQRKQFCSIGSLKSNIGHCESAAGVAGLTKVLLQLKYGYLVPSLHAAVPNSEIDFSQTPFKVQTVFEPWRRASLEVHGVMREVPRTAGVSSFGAGGANAHVIVQEYLPPQPILLMERDENPEVLIVLSAATEGQLRERAADLLRFLRSSSKYEGESPQTLDLASIGYTLQVGRQAMEERLGFVVKSINALVEMLTRVASGDPGTKDLYRGSGRPDQGGISLVSRDPDLLAAVDKWLVHGSLLKLLETWVKGQEVDWKKLYKGVRPHRMSLPLYPFARERYWTDTPPERKMNQQAVGEAILHPMVQRNTSDLDEQRFTSTFTGGELFLADHRLTLDGQLAQKVLPAVVYLEMARVALDLAWPGLRRSGGSVEFRNVAWAQPFIVEGERQLHLALWAKSEDEVEFEIYSQTAQQETVHCQGMGVRSQHGESAQKDVELLQREFGEPELTPRDLYAAWQGMGALHGPAFQVITRLYRGKHQVLAKLKLPNAWEGTTALYGLHPALMDGAQQAAIGLIEGPNGNITRVPFALDSLQIYASCRPEMTAWVRSASNPSTGGNLTLDIDLLDENGTLCVRMQGLSSRPVNNRAIPELPPEPKLGVLLASPEWRAERINHKAGRSYNEHHIILCEIGSIDLEELIDLLPHSECLSLNSDDRPSIAERYREYALSSFRRIQTIMRSKPEGGVLVQMVVGSAPDQTVLHGLKALLMTATRESPQIVGQLVIVPGEWTTQQLAACLKEETECTLEPFVRYEGAIRFVQRWREIPNDQEKPNVAFKANGVYLITGGLGALGMVFAQEILKQSSNAKVILIGRSVANEDSNQLIKQLGMPGQVSYRSLDVTDRDKVQQLISEIQSEHGLLSGILHGAGTVADDFIINKTTLQFNNVVLPKITGAYNLDEASKEIELDLFVLFSSVSGAVGNAGQADYATANAFLDGFAAYRNNLVAAKKRHGKTRSINWGAWRAGGMGGDPAHRAALEQTTGMMPLRTEHGIDALYRSLTLSCDQLLVAEGDLIRLRSALEQGREDKNAGLPVKDASLRSDEADALLKRTEDYLKREFSDLLQVPLHKIDTSAPLERYGIDSILAMKLTAKLEEVFGSLSKTLFFEYQTLSALAAYFLKSHTAILRDRIGWQAEVSTTIASSTPLKIPAVTGPGSRRGRTAVAASAYSRDEIAIVGLAGRYPQADDVREFWKNLQAGLDCITEIPQERWDHAPFYDADPNERGKTYCKWGGFIRDVDKFDALFFNISPREAALLDPQERLFLQTAWEAIEDAGYSKAAMAGGRVGVYVGAMWGHYQLFGPESIAQGLGAIPNSSYASIANRVSYFFDLHGPSLAVDTMCSSSLTAIHLACEELRKGEIDAAIAGGVNVSIHPMKFFSLSQGKFGASDGRCRSFGDGGNGYVPGEGVGAVLLKPLSHALRDRDHVYGVVKSSVLNHGGKTNGYTVPNPKAQGDLISDALRKAKIDPKTLGYIETHGTGTALGDPIEVAGLLRAFENDQREVQFCPIGSVKSNIGHLESAAGMAALTKVLLQIKHRRLVPSLHANPPNANIDFNASPFYVQTELAEWAHTAAHPRRAGVSSFGAGGSNAHLIIEEHPDSEVVGQPTNGEVEAFLLSAKDLPALRRYAERNITYLQYPSAAFGDIVFTSQVGRSHMDCRLVVLASNTEELRGKLLEWITTQDRSEVTSAGVAHEENGIYLGNLAEAPPSVGTLIGGRAGKAFLEDLIGGRDMEKLARFWVLGIDVDWDLLHRVTGRRRASLPTYPFAKERHWVETNASFSALRGKATIISSPPEKLLVFTEEKCRLAYSPQWIPQPLETTKSVDMMATILIMDTSEDLTEDMKQMSLKSGRSGSVILVRPGQTFAEVSTNSYILNMEGEKDFDLLVERLRAQELMPEVILNYGSGAYDLAVKAEVANDLNMGCYAISSLCRALLRAKHPSLSILALYCHSNGEPSPLRAAISGILKTLALENPHYRGKVVEFQQQTSGTRARIIWDELNDATWQTDDISYRALTDDNERVYTRYAKKLVALPVGVERNLALPFRYQGIYLITGGLGGLGLIFAEYLARAFKAKLVLVGRKPPEAAQQEVIQRLRSHGAEVLVIQADISRPEDAERAVTETLGRFFVVNGVIHAAGQVMDSLLLNKTRNEMDAVLAPKIYGTINLDLATRLQQLDFFVLFSSVTSVFGNPGQGDYAFGNHFLDSFATYRQMLRAAGQRTGQTLSINWPLWEEGGMQVRTHDLERLSRATGLLPLPTKDGIAYLEEFLHADMTQVVPLYGSPAKITAFLAGTVARSQVFSLPEFDTSTLMARTEDYLKVRIGNEINLAPERIGSTERLEAFGIDSIMIQRLNTVLENDLGELSKTLLYEHETVHDVARFLLQDRRDTVMHLLSDAHVVVDSQKSVASATLSPTSPNTIRVLPEDHQSIAIVGIHGNYPQSPNLEEFWQNLRAGKDLISLVPFRRWDSEGLYSQNPADVADGKIYCKWGGLLDGYDTFDASFFNISADEAKLMDPQERLFLQSVWASIEDAGYTRDRLKKLHPKARSADVGVFVGVTTNTYNLWAPEESLQGNNICPTALPWSIANRVSYFFDFAGPSLPVDTACSSSLVAVHLACEALKHGDCQVAIAGGVNLYLHPAKYQSLCQRRMLALHGKTRSYGAGDDGFIPGEGVGSMVLKPLQKAIEHGDHIYAIIPASAYDHSGRSNGYSAPNPNSQATLISHTLSKANIHPETIGYVEGHGTGTQLGDSLEVAALTQAFGTSTPKKQFCAIGSVKANIGHTESASGVAAMAKIIMQMKYGQLVPTIHSQEVNPNIDFQNTPFHLQHDLSSWPIQPGSPRRALVNSFGAGGVNACLVLEEFSSADLLEGPQSTFCLFVLSARTPDRLRKSVEQILPHLGEERSPSLHDLCYTLQVGREAMEERLAIAVSDSEQLAGQLRAWLGGNPSAETYRGSNVSQRTAVMTIDHHDFSKIAYAWVSGQQIDWECLHEAYPRRPHRISIPTYPFACERHWFPRSTPLGTARNETSPLHPLLSYNSSTLRETSFISKLPADAFYALDHRLNGEGIFPGAGFLEIACMAGNIAAERRVRSLSGVAWVRPLSFAEGLRTVQTSLKQVGDTVEYVVSSLNVENEAVVHSEGRLHFTQDWADSPLTLDSMDIASLKKKCTHYDQGENYYKNLREHGLEYGPSFQSIHEFYSGGSYALSKLRIPDHLIEDFGQYILHPSIIDGVFQTAGLLVDDFASPVPHLPFALDEINIFHPVRHTCFAYCEFSGIEEPKRSDLSKFNIRLLNESGDVLVDFRGLFARALPDATTSYLEGAAL